MIIKGYIFTYLFIFLLIGLTSFIKKGELSRKIIHIGVSFYFVISYKYFGSTIHMIVPPITFIIINYISYKKNIFKSMETYNSPGTVYYAISVFLLSLITYSKPEFYPYYGIGLFIMAFGDGLAPLISHLVNKNSKGKTWAGSLTVFVVSLIIGIVFNKIFILNFQIWKIILIGIISVILEYIGKKGIDNITLPIGVAFISWILGVV